MATAAELAEALGEPLGGEAVAEGDAAAPPLAAHTGTPPAG